MTATPNVDALLRLMAWMSPAFPVGAFSYSGGLETAVSDRRVTDTSQLREWIALSLTRGAMWNDAVLLTQAWHESHDAHALADLSELGLALAGSAERHRETLLLGHAFAEAASAWPGDVFGILPKAVPYPVAVGAIAACHAVPLKETLATYLHSGVSQLISAAIRLGVAGQKQGTSLLAGLEEEVVSVSGLAASSSLDDLGSATIIADTSPMRHEVQRTRLFRS